MKYTIFTYLSRQTLQKVDLLMFSSCLYRTLCESDWLQEVIVAIIVIATNVKMWKENRPKENTGNGVYTTPQSHIRPKGLLLVIN